MSDFTQDQDFDYESFCGGILSDIPGISLVRTNNALSFEVEGKASIAKEIESNTMVDVLRMIDENTKYKSTMWMRAAAKFVALPNEFELRANRSDNGVRVKLVYGEDSYDREITEVIGDLHSLISKVQESPASSKPSSE